MLAKVLDKRTCAACRFCCSFRRSSLWETPLFPEDTAKKLSEKNSSGRTASFSYQGEGKGACAQMQLQGKYRTDDPAEEAACEFLDEEKGCVLGEEDKPFDCKIWPLRIMKKDDMLVIALTPTCPAISSLPGGVMKQLVGDGLGQQIYDYAKQHPFIVKEYREGFEVMASYEQF